ncbi:MAG TPA: DUF4383 domain-containing protein [Candidatus Limnocylindria bacterium]|nr:DUF4383 domain-containing protein [Candidatus Limnocylindria bacterium]
MSIARTVVLVLGAVYVLVGILGFIPAVAEEVAGVDEMDSATALLLGIFPINVLHNFVHLAIGAVLLWGATSTGAAIMAARGVGIVYLLVGLLGFVAPDTFGLMPIGGNDIWLHLATALILLVIGFWPEAATERVDART